MVVRGARQHNLKNIDIKIPRGNLVVVTGVSGSGKSSLAFDTIFAEGQRRYVESLSAYARQFLGQLDKPDVDGIDGLSPAISIDQKSTSHNPRSTVGTVTEIYDYLRLLFARVGTPHCPECDRLINPQTIDQIVDQVLELTEGTKIQILAPLASGKKGEYQSLFVDLRKEGFARVRVDGVVHELEDEIKLDKNKKHNIDLVVDRLVIKKGIQSRLADSIALGLKWGKQNVLVDTAIGTGGGSGKDLLFSENFACGACGISFAELSPRIFSFNSPYGACEECHGLGCTFEVDPALVVPDPKKTLKEGAIYPWAKTNNPYYDQLLASVAKHYKFSVNTPFGKLTKQEQGVILFGSGTEKLKLGHDSFDGKEFWEYKKSFEGVINNIKRRHEESQSDRVRQDIENYMTQMPCSKCNGARLKPESLSVKIHGKSIAQVSALSVEKAVDYFANVPDKLTTKQRTIAHQVLIEVNARLKFLSDVGLTYLTLDRQAGTLSGGEAQRIRLATQIGSGLSGVLYVLDEPSIGLHQRDNSKLINTLKRLRDLGNTLLVVEHDEDTMRESDWIIDIGPGAGVHGGELVAEGTIEDIMVAPRSSTGAYLSGRKKIVVPKKRRPGNGLFIEVKDASLNNLKNISLSIPLGKFVAVTGVSGSGKSTLVNDLLYQYLRHHFSGTVPAPKGVDKITGLDALDKVIDIDQSPIGRTPRSNPATYTGLFDVIREVFSMTTEAKARGYLPGRFSFNVKGGRCEACRGEGMNEIEMNFLPSVFVTCDVCKGARYNRETLEVKFKGRSISEVLEMTVEEGLKFFENIPKAQSKLETLQEVGLDYVKLGQPATTLSGGEAQRVKLAEQLSKRSTGKTIYILDEPTTGLSFADVDKLLHVLNRLADTGNTVLIIEHNLDVIKQADWVIDLGPEGGDKGGTLVAEGTPEQIARAKSHTGEYLKRYLSDGLVAKGSLASK
ncbi:MAG: excinuclease ABC subunit UvrA [Candidatus Obscuribacter sp.]|nr:excinuclease ABC subunit UvrA [Candidatus Obscuribacter sp.]MBK9203799.1 excinuclease ABC subunit UvrA [Candidatus Obscuribacter sp.]MBK9774298.1 excinuclease ABC subunit UvrA [Candidatus Obscuribacter sp.]MBL0187686.1 excinuclease ABC subunit UvrA [Candidatus Obscuribacter sp.]